MASQENHDPSPDQTQVEEEDAGDLSGSITRKKRSIGVVESSSDSDEAPEVLSKVAGKRQIKQKEVEIGKFAKATARARREANRSRDEKLKKNSQARKPKVPTDTETNPPTEPLSSDDKSLTDQVTLPNTKKYLEPSLFASASNILEQSRKEARELEKSKTLTSRRKKRKNLQNQNCRDVGNNTTVVLLPQAEHISPAPRPTSATNFERNNLYTKHTRSRIRLPKASLAAKAELGTRKGTVDSIQARRSLKPAVLFTRS